MDASPPISSVKIVGHTLNVPFIRSEIKTIQKKRTVGNIKVNNVRNQVRILSFLASLAWLIVELPFVVRVEDGTPVPIEASLASHTLYQPKRGRKGSGETP